jgi:hypothetical protein
VQCPAACGGVPLLILRGHKLALQNALNKVFSTLGEVFSVPTASAYSQARQKLKPEIFTHLNEIVCRDFYQLYDADHLVKRWHNHRLLACDGTYLHLPDTPQMREQFSVQTNQYEDGACVQALACVLYDVLNDLSLAAGIGKRQGEKKLLFAELWQATQAEDVILFDRHYADYTIFARALAENRQVIVRLPSKSFAAARQFWQSQQEQQIIELSCPSSSRAYVKEQKLPEELRLRLVRVVLSNGTTEVLATTLLDSQAYAAEEFQEVYFYRWGEETFFDRLKNIFEVERFSGSSVTSIKQDFFGVLFLASLESVLSKADEQGLQQESQQRETKSEARVNHAVSYVALVERVVQLLLSEASTERILEELHHLFRTTPSRARPGRQIQRCKELRYAYKLRFHKYVKKLLA